MKRIFFTFFLAIIAITFAFAQLPADSLVLFHDSPDNRFYDNSVIYQTAPSTVVAEPFVAGAANGDKFPVVVTPVKGGANALKLQWNSAAGGDWKALVASIGWGGFDLTTMNFLRFWVNSPAALDTAAMPMIYLEAVTGTPGVTGKVRMSKYVTAGLMANMWTVVSIPLADIWAKDVMFTAKNNIKDVFFSQNKTDNVEHTLYLDEFTFSMTTGIVDQLGNQIKVYYSNGEIHFSNYSGHVRVFDLIGRLVTEGNAFNGSMSAKLNSGVYIISIKEGNTKIVLE